MKATYTIDVKPIIREWLDSVERNAKERKDMGGSIESCLIADNVIMACRNLSTVLEGFLRYNGLNPLGTEPDELPF